MTMRFHLCLKALLQLALLALLGLYFYPAEMRAMISVITHQLRDPRQYIVLYQERQTGRTASPDFIAPVFIL